MFKLITKTIQFIVVYVQTEYIEVIPKDEPNYVNVCGARPRERKLTDP